MIDPYLEFKDQKFKFFHELKKGLHLKIKGAKSKNAALDEFKSSVLDVEQKKLLSVLGEHSEFMKKLHEFKRINNTMDISEAFIFNLNTMALKNKKAFISNIARYDAICDFYKFWNQKYFHFIGAKAEKALKHQIRKQQRKVTWKGKRETDFVQLVYALFEAGYISNTQSEIIGMVEQLAKTFNLQLSKDWKSNFSKNLNCGKSGCRPEIFINIERGFNRYCEKIKMMQKSFNY